MSRTSMEKSNHVLEKELHVEHLNDNLHVHNELAFKGDDSDGKVDWSARHAIAALSLGMLYTGTCCSLAGT